jgi:hypothetical protein
MPKMIYASSTMSGAKIRTARLGIRSSRES